MYERFTTDDGSRSIAVGTNIVSALPEVLRACKFSRRLIVVSDRTVANRFFHSLRRALEDGGFDVVAAFVPTGEHRKNLKSSADLSSLLLEGAIDTHAGLVAFGGGAVGDLAGFAAATYLTGLPYVQIPTTLTAQLENLAMRRPALNHPQQKDLIAVDHAPRLVWSDLHYLESLPRRQRLSGVCTLVARSAALSAELFGYIETHLEGLREFKTDNIAEVVKKVAEAAVVGEGSSPGWGPGPYPGDTMGDALQLAGRYRGIPYGEARLLGLLTEAYVSHQVGHLKKREFDRLLAVAEQLPAGFSLGSVKPWDILRALKYDSKALVRSRGIRCLVRIGEQGEVEGLEEGRLIDALRWALDWVGSQSSKPPAGPTS